MRCATNTCLTLLLLFTALLSAGSDATEETSCPLGISTGSQTWDGRIYGEAPYLCLGSAGNCKYRLDYVSVCSNVSYECDGTFVSTGETCTESEGSNGDMMWPGGDLLEEPDDGDGSGDGDGETDPSVQLQNYLKATCVNGVCTGTVETNSNITAMLKASYDWSQFMNREGYSEIMDELTLSIPQHIVRAGERTREEIIYKIDDVSRQVASIDLSDLDPTFAEIQSTLSDHASASTSQFYRLMEYVAPINGLFGGVNGNIQTLSGTVSGLRSELNNHLTYNDSLVTKNGQDIAQLSNSLSTLSGDVSGLADGLEALSSQISGAGGTGGDVDLSGVESKLQGIQETLDGKGMVGRPFEGQVDFEANGLYGTDAIENLEGEIEQLETQYQEQMGQFKSLFTFDESELADGTYIEHKWTFRTANGHVNSFSSGVFPALLENSSLIAAVLLFLAVLLGIKALTN